MIKSFSDAVQMWNYFHDGEIVKITQTDTQVYEVEIEIAYLMKEITGKEEGVFQIELEGCKKIGYEPYKLSAEFDISFNSEISIGILYGEAKDNKLAVDCSRYQDQTKSFEAGLLHLEYDSCKVFLMGTEITLAQLDNAQKSYWDKFGN